MSAQTPLPPLRSAARIAVLRALNLGDLLCAVPALRALRAAAPSARITLIGLPWARAFVDRFGLLVDAFVEYPFGEALPAPGSAEMEAFLAPLRARRFDLALQMHGDGSRSNAIVGALGARMHGGFHPPDTPAPGPWYLPWQDDESEIRRWLRLAEHLGAGRHSEALEFPLRDNDREAAAALLSARGVRGPYLCVHPGARLRSRRWPLTRFAAVAGALRADGWPLVLTGCAGEAELTAGLADALRPPPWAPPDPPVVDLAGCTDLGTLAALIDGAAGLVCNDTGVSHIAAALATPSLVVSCGSDVRRWAPGDRTRHRVLAAHPPCRPCAFDDCPHGHVCALEIGSVHALAGVRRLLEELQIRAA
ncbi:MAG: glycosyltransferase family 9 protein [Pseudomonadota bacterium]